MPAEAYPRLLSFLQSNPSLTQRELACALGVSLVKSNNCLKALKDKGLIKLGNLSANSKKLQYTSLLTPKNVAKKLALIAYFLRRKETECLRPQHGIASLRAELEQPPHAIEYSFSSHPRWRRDRHVTNAKGLGAPSPINHHAGETAFQKPCIEHPVVVLGIGYWPTRIYSLILWLNH